MYSLFYKLETHDGNYYFLGKDRKSSSSLLSILTEDEYVRYVVFNEVTNDKEQFYEEYISYCNNLFLRHTNENDIITKEYFNIDSFFTEYFNINNFFEVLFNELGVGNFVDIEKYISLGFQILYVEYIKRISPMYSCMQLYVLGISIRKRINMPIEYIDDRNCDLMINWIWNNASLTQKQSNVISKLIDQAIKYFPHGLCTADFLYTMWSKVYKEYAIYDILPIFEKEYIKEIKFLTRGRYIVDFRIVLNKKIYWDDIETFKKVFLNYAKKKAMNIELPDEIEKSDKAKLRVRSCEYSALHHSILVDILIA